MKNGNAVLLVKFRSGLSPKELMDNCHADLDEFRSVPGLLQKYYLGDESEGAISGFYIFENKNARDLFWESELAKKIPARYGVVLESLRVERYSLDIVLNEK